MAERVRRRRAAPLRYAELWHRPLPHTSQRKLGELVRDPDVDAVLCSGGNGSGKTELGAQVAVAVASGRHDPSARAWCDRNSFPLERLPDRPGRVLASALTSKFSIRVQREKVKTYLPKGSVWRNEFGDGEATVDLPNGGRVVFLANDQKARSFQGDWADFWWPDEEHDYDVFKEAMMRVARVPGGMGWALLTMTPLKGRTWVYDEFVAEKKPGRAAMWIHGEDNRYLPAEKMERVLSNYGEHEQAARRRGEFTVLEGLVYSAWRRHLHVVPHATTVLDPNWPRYVGVDFGTRNPAGWCWIAVDPGDDVIHVVREHKKAGWLNSQHAQVFHSVYAPPSTEPRPRAVIADPEDAQARMEMASRHGISTVPARKDVRPGINAIAERLAPDAQGKPHLVIHDCCPELIREIEGYVWAPRTGERDAPDMPLKANDHLLDALRYVTFYLRSGQMGIGATRQPEREAI